MFDACGNVRDTFTALRRNSKMRHREIAEQLNISEGELIATHVGGASDDPNMILHATRLRPEWPEIIGSLETLGEVLAITRNVSCVHEKTGIYCNISHHGQVGLVQGKEIDLRIFYEFWAHGFAVDEQTDKGLQHSIQFFDAEGIAIHKIFLKPSSNVMAYTRLVTNFASNEQALGIGTKKPTEKLPERADTEIDLVGFRLAWESLRDTYDFYGLLETYGVTQAQAMRLADARYVKKVEMGDCQSLLHAVAAGGVPIMVFVGNPGIIQIYSGPISNVAVMGNWVNVLDTGFNLHLREDHIANAWIVKKPSDDGLVTSLELYDALGNTIALFFGERKPGKRELCEWRSLIDTIPQRHRQCVA